MNPKKWLAKKHNMHGKYNTMQINSEDDYLKKWRIQKNNEAQDFTYFFPKLPLFLRIQRAINRSLVLLQIFFATVFILGLCVSGVDEYFFNIEQPMLLEITIFSMPMTIICILLRTIQSLIIWRCPYCGIGFPYYSAGRRVRILKRKSVLYQMEGLKIEYDEPWCCSLVLPSVCPNCRKKFYKISKKL